MITCSKWQLLYFLAVLIFVVVPICADTGDGTYKVGPEDVVVVTVARHTELSGDFLVPADGVLNLPGAGQVNATSKTLNELAADIAEALGDRLREPEVTVSLRSARAQRVYVLGAVKTPGSYDAKPKWRLTEALAAAGGLAAGVENSDCCASVLRASTGKRETIKLEDVLNGAPESNAQIESGDVLTIETQETMPIYVMGKVKSPGLYRVRTDNPTAMSALTLAGGTLDDAAVDRVRITHLSGESEFVNLASALVSGGSEQKAKLQSGDLVVVPEQTSRIAVLGYVKNPGFYALKSGHTVTLLDAIGMANGAEKRAEMGSVAILRTISGKQQRLTIDTGKFLKAGDIAGNPQIQPGDVVFVPQTTKLDWEMIMRSAGSLGMLIYPFTL